MEIPCEPLQNMFSTVIYVELGLKDTLESVGRYYRGRYSDCEAGAAIPRISDVVSRLRWDKGDGTAAMVLQAIPPGEGMMTATTPSELTSHRR